MNSRPLPPRFQLQVSPILPDGSFGYDEFIELNNPELEDEDLRTYVGHAAKLLETKRLDSIGLALYRERIEIAMDYIYAELERRLNG